MICVNKHTPEKVPVKAPIPSFTCEREVKQIVALKQLAEIIGIFSKNNREEGAILKSGSLFGWRDWTVGLGMGPWCHGRPQSRKVDTQMC